MEFGWNDFEPDESSDAIPGKWILTITQDGEEFATIVHRDCNGRYPIDGWEAERKRANAQRIVNALNAQG